MVDEQELDMFALRDDEEEAGQVGEAVEQPADIGGLVDVEAGGSGGASGSGGPAVAPPPAPVLPAPSAPAEPLDPFRAEQEKVYTCPRCRGQHRAHTYDDRCKLGQHVPDAECNAVRLQQREEDKFHEVPDDEEHLRLQLQEIFKEGGMTPATMQQIRETVGAEREDWKQRIIDEVFGMKHKLV